MFPLKKTAKWQVIRRFSTQLEISLPQIPFFPRPATFSVPFATFDGSSSPLPTLMPPDKATQALAPPLTQDEEIYALSMLDLASLLTGLDIRTLFTEPKIENIFRALQSLVSVDLSANPLSNSPVRSLFEAMVF